MILIKDLDKYYRKGKADEVHVIDHTTLTLPKTGLVCILGESGSGKTTLLNAIGGLDGFDGGTVEADGVKASAGRGQVRQLEHLRNAKYAYIFQNYYLLQDRTAAYNIGLALNLYPLSGEEKEARVDYVLKSVDMWKYKKRIVSSLSGGQQQRIAIARALVKSPEVVFADEPTGNLDAGSTIRIMKLLKKVSERCLVVMVTHERSLAEVYADRIIVVDRGKVVSDRLFQGTGGVRQPEDSNLYLKEFREERDECGPVSICRYAEGEMPELNLRIIYDGRRFYLQTPENDQTVWIERNGFRQVIDGERPELAEEGNMADFQLGRLDGSGQKRRNARGKGSALTAAEVLKLAVSSFQAAGKRQAALCIALVVMAVLAVISAADILTLKSLDIDSVVKWDSRYLLVSTEKNGAFDNEQYRDDILKMLRELEESGVADSIQFYFQTDLTYRYQGFRQLEGLNAQLSGYSFAPLSRLSPDRVLFGRMPEAPDEIVLDIRVAKNFLKADNELSAVIGDPQYLVGKEISIFRKDWTLKIAGICDSGEPDLYVDPIVRLSIPTWVGNFAGFKSLAAAYPERYGGIKLLPGEVLVSERFYKQRELNRQTETFTVPLGTEFRIAGIYPDEFGFDFVIAEEGYEELLFEMICQAKELIVEADDKQAAAAFLQEDLSDDLAQRLQIFIRDPYEEQIASYRNARRIKPDARMIVTLTVILVSAMLLYVTMRTAAVRKAADIAVYRLLGIRKSSIYAAYCLELLMISACTTLPAALLTSCALKFAASVPSLGSDLYYPWYAAAGVTVGLTALNLAIGLLPAAGIIRLLPARLAEKYEL